VEAPRTRGRLIGPFTSKWAATTLLERLLELYDLRRCARRLDARLAMMPCAARDAGTCPAPCVRVPDAEAYASRLAQAVTVLEDDTDFRQRLIIDQRAAVEAGRYEDAIRDRDGLRALDRALSSYEQIVEAVTRDSVMIEESDGQAVVSFIRGGLRAAVLRGDRDSVATKLDAALDRVYFNDTPAIDPLRLSSEKIAEILIIAGFEESGAFLGLPVTTADDTGHRIRRALGLERRMPRRRHAVPSGA
jgi:excinuclease UvrABC nuclease subunit